VYAEFKDTTYKRANLLQIIRNEIPQQYDFLPIRTLPLVALVGDVIVHYGNNTLAVGLDKQKRVRYYINMKPTIPHLGTTDLLPVTTYFDREIQNCQVGISIDIPVSSLQRYPSIAKFTYRYVPIDDYQLDRCHYVYAENSWNIFDTRTNEMQEIPDQCEYLSYLLLQNACLGFIPGFTHGPKGFSFSEEHFDQGYVVPKAQLMYYAGTQ